jgi:hypothetical protein
MSTKQDVPLLPTIPVSFSDVEADLIELGRIDVPSRVAAAAARSDHAVAVLLSGLPSAKHASVLSRRVQLKISDLDTFIVEADRVIEAESRELPDATELSALETVVTTAQNAALGEADALERCCALDADAKAAMQAATAALKKTRTRVNLPDDAAVAATRNRIAELEKELEAERARLRDLDIGIGELAEAKTRCTEVAASLARWEKQSPKSASDAKSKADALEARKVIAAIRRRRIDAARSQRIEAGAVRDRIQRALDAHTQMSKLLPADGVGVPELVAMAK